MKSQRFILLFLMTVASVSCKSHTAEKVKPVVVQAKVLPPLPINKKPTVVPSLRTWIGKRGYFTLSPHSRIIARSEALTSLASQFSADINGISGIKPAVLTSADTKAEESDLVLEINSTTLPTNTEGYTLNAE